MRTLVISMLIFLTASFSLIPASAQSTEESSSEQQQTAAVSATAEPNTVIADTEETTGMSATEDPNIINARVEQFEGLDDELRQLNAASKGEMRGWTRRTEDRLGLTLAVQQQTATELQFLRELAVEEGAVKTVTAIDKILLDREERYAEVIERFERERERLRREEEREERDRERRERNRRNR